MRSVEEDWASEYENPCADEKAGGIEMVGAGTCVIITGADESPLPSPNILFSSAGAKTTGTGVDPEAVPGTITVTGSDALEQPIIPASRITSNIPAINLFISPSC
jgi:hypothetical protein